MFCKHCGKEINLDSFFCCYCGSVQYDDNEFPFHTVEVELSYNSSNFVVHSYNFGIINKILTVVKKIDPNITQSDNGILASLSSQGMISKDCRVKCGQLTEKYLLEHGFHRQPNRLPGGEGGWRNGIFEKKISKPNN